MSQKEFIELAKLKRQLEVEKSLERVRARTMAMKKSEELAEVATVLHTELGKLDVNEFSDTSIVIFDQANNKQTVWGARTGSEFLEKSIMPLLGDQILQKLYDKWCSKKAFFSLKVEGETLKDHIEFVFPKADRTEIEDRVIKNMPDPTYFHCATFSMGYLELMADKKLGEDSAHLLTRFANVFEQTYTRFLDLKKAEDQTREAQIETALERVRATSLSMRKTSDISRVVEVYFRQLRHLNIDFIQAWINVFHLDEGYFDIWFSPLDGVHKNVTHFQMPSALFEETTIKSWRKGEPFSTLSFNSESEVDAFLNACDEVTGSTYFSRAQKSYRFDRLEILDANYKYGAVSRTTRDSPTEQHKRIFQRFAKVFEQAYTRFLDLQKAEAQAREAQIEAAMERIRNRALIMKDSRELNEVVSVFFNEFNQLDLVPPEARTYFCDINSNTHTAEVWMTYTNGEVMSGSHFTPLTRSASMKKYYEAWKRKEPISIRAYKGKNLDSYISFVSSLPHVKKDKDYKKLFKNPPKQVFMTDANFLQGNIGIMSFDPLSEEALEVLQRFAKVFEFTYTRFLDLKKAEAQAREAQIEAALERVRASSMSMNSSDELHDVLSVLFEQFYILGINPVNVFLSLFSREEGTLTYRATGTAGSRTQGQQVVRLDSLDVWKELFEKWKNDNSDDVEVVYYERDILPKLFSLLDETFSSMPPEERLRIDQFPEGGYTMHGYTPFGYIGYNHTRPPTEEEKSILTKFASEFSRVYQRFLDIQKAEAQAREAQIEAALERVRGRTMAMHNSEELGEVVKVLYQEFIKLELGDKHTDIEICIIDEESGEGEIWQTEDSLTGQNTSLKLPFTKIKELRKEFLSWKNTDPENRNNLFFIQEYSNECLKDFLYVLRQIPEWKSVVDAFKKNKIKQWITYNSYFKYGMLTYQNIEWKATEIEIILPRFAKVFEQTYTRFLDLKKAEAQVREAEIQLALERVRAATMAMHDSDGLSEVVNVLMQQIEVLGIDCYSSMIVIPHDVEFSSELWMSNDLRTDIHNPMNFPFNKRMAFSREWWKSWKDRNAIFHYEIKGKSYDRFVDYMFTKTDFAYLPDEIESLTRQKKHLHNTTAFCSNAGLMVNSDYSLSDEARDILIRFAKVFEQSYTRFLDLKKAEAQTREAQIEAALERVRARSMAMHSSNELKEVAAIMYEQMEPLELAKHGCEIILCNEDNDQLQFWSTNLMQTRLPEPYNISRFSHPVFRKQWKAWKQKLDRLVITNAGKAKRDFDDFIFSKTDFSKFPKHVKKFIRSGKKDVFSHVIMKFGLLEAVDDAPLSEEKFQVLERFAKVFEQTYTRFLDLQKAEAQAREAQIEAALERVRSRSMAMHRSEELGEVIEVVFNQMVGLDLPVDHVGFILDYREREDMHIWFASRQVKPSEITIPYFDSPHWNSFRKAKAKGEKFFTNLLDFKTKNKFYKELFKHIPPLPGAATKNIFERPGLVISTALLDKVGLYFENYTQVPFTDDENDLLIRFAKVFEQAYIRFLDLQEAEARVREAQIEAALERVRASSMAMHVSTDIGEVAKVMFDQLDQLAIETIRMGILIFHDNQTMDAWGATANREGKGNTIQIIGAIENKGHPILEGAYNTWKQKKKHFRHKLEGNDLKLYYETLAKSSFRVPSIKNLPKIQVLDQFHFGDGALYSFTREELDPASFRIFERFANAFGQAYRRYLDIKRAEAQAREAQIEASLERVRASSMAMHKSEELAEVATVLYEELTKLGIKDFVNCGFVEVDEEGKGQNGWNTMPDGSIAEGYYLPLKGDKILEERYKSWKKKEPVFYQSVGGKKLKDHMAFVFETIVSEQVREMTEQSFPDPTIFYCFNFSHGYLHIITDRVFSEEHQKILVRFSKAFEQTYTRFLDLKKAEAQAREAEIQLSLERVRARSMAMHNSDELSEVLSLLFQQFDILDITPSFAHLTLFDEDNDTFLFRMTGLSGERILFEQVIDVNKMDAWKSSYSAWKKEKEGSIVCIDYPPEALPEVFDIFSETFKALPRDSKMKLKDFPGGLYTTQGHCKFGYLGFNHTRRATAEEKEIVARFAKEFGLVYQRFLDLQKAEAQVREAEIEAGLERVRSQAMAMQNSEDLHETINEFFNQLRLLDIVPVRCGVAQMFDDPPSWEATATNAMDQGKTLQLSGIVDNLDHPVSKGIYDHWVRQEDYFPVLKGENLEKYYDVLRTDFSVPKYPKEEVHHGHYFNFREGNIFAWTYIPLTDTEKLIFKRFSSVLSLSYRRYLDLKESEAQARESEIEAALERVRARAMGMKSSDELSDLIITIFKELQKLDMVLTRCLLWIFEQQDRSATVWMTNSEDPDQADHYHVPHHNHPAYKSFLQGWKNRQEKWEYELKGKIKDRWDEILVNDYFKSLSARVKKAMKDPERVILSGTFNKYGVIQTASLESLSAENQDILKRFSHLFEQNYTRFLDLQKAEEQAREAQIETALERIRARALAMHSSSELIEVAIVLREQMGKLGQEELESSIVHIYKDEEQEIEAWYAFRNPENKRRKIITGTAHIDYNSSQWSREVVRKYKSDEDDYTIRAAGAKLREWYNVLSKVAPKTLEYDKKGELIVPKVLYYHFSRFSGGALMLISNREPSEDAKSLQIRAAKEFDLAYQRFHDLKLSELREKEAIKQSSLDRVRAEIATMRSTDDFNRITPIVWRELRSLGIPFFRCGVFIVEEEVKKVRVFLSNPEGESLAAWYTDYEPIPLFNESVKSWKAQKVYREEWNEKDFENFTNQLIKQGLIEDVESYQAGSEAPKYLSLQLVPFKQGMLYIGSSEKLTADQVSLAESLAMAFSTAYARYQDFGELEAAKGEVEHALSDLRATQEQLVHSEKMASLGELTAGIAHEIQNPLNFVNNFSDVNTELVEELREELKEGNLDVVEAILNDLKDNESKILHHGKRAEEIVRSMLQHSRGSEGEKVATDLNTLADEYMRLSYHGLRAKDKSFNADFELDLDPDLPEIKVVPQDIGRVLLNLINNAFQACAEQSERAGADRSVSTYQPKVTLTTQLLNNSITIRVADNGPGIPDNIRDKIFQPFFTTKPTGQGTGLGLSMSYDIVTKGHGGKLEVESGSESGKGTEFVILLPLG